MEANVGNLLKWQAISFMWLSLTVALLPVSVYRVRLEQAFLNFFGPRTIFSKTIRWTTLLCWHLMNSWWRIYGTPVDYYKFQVDHRLRITVLEASAIFLQNNF